MELFPYLIFLNFETKWTFTRTDLVLRLDEPLPLQGTPSLAGEDLFLCINLERARVGTTLSPNFFEMSDYGFSLTTFSQKGKLFQIEYALNAIQNVSCDLFLNDSSINLKL